MDEKPDKAESATPAPRRRGRRAQLTAAPFKFDADSWYPEVFLRLHGFDGDVLSKARRSGALRHHRQGSQVFFKGSWLLEWLEQQGPRAD